MCVLNYDLYLSIINNYHIFHNQLIMLAPYLSANFSLNVYRHQRTIVLGTLLIEQKYNSQSVN